MDLSLPLGRLPLADAVFNRVVELIMTGSLPPGSQLKIAELSQLLGTSATPVREALARLEGQGLVDRSPMKGFTVALPLQPHEVGQLMDARMLLEPEMARLAVEA